MTTLVFTGIADWPPLAWRARCDARTGEVAVWHGPRVETAGAWFCEAVWDGEYESGDFDRTDIVAGSGGRLRDGAITFVASGSGCDRLHSFEPGDGTAWISNSLPCLLAAIGGEVDPTDPGYGPFFLSVRRGLDAYERWLPTSAGRVQLTYFDNLRWADGTLAVVPKPFAARTFADFAAYRGFLARSMAAMLANARAPRRTHAIRPLGTLSSGYDSTTVTVLARQAGLQEAITFTRGFIGPSLGAPTEEDSGTAVAEKLGLACHAVGRREREALEEVPFFAATAAGEDLHFLDASRYLAGRLLFTGFYGDNVWGKRDTEPSEPFVRRNIDGLSLSEYRLWAGFLNCPVPYWAVRSLAQIRAITHSEEMRPWDVGGRYSRPICRRIVEDAGIPRGTFATRKRATAAFPLWRRSFLTAASADDYVRWLRAHRHRWLRARRLPPPTSLRWDRLAMSAVRLLETSTERVAWSVANRTGWSALPRHPLVERLRTLTHPGTPGGPWLPALRRHVFPWALAAAVRRYRSGGT